jgi:two-component system chemotaxis sensor kinase CheA
MEEVIVEFLVESRECLDRIDRDLLALEETSPADPALIASVFRALHTIKGTAGFLAFQKMQGVAHAGETLLGRVRDGERAFDRDVAVELFSAVDAIREMLGSVDAFRTEGDRDYAGLVASLGRLAGGDADQAARAELEALVQPAAPAPPPPAAPPDDEPAPHEAPAPAAPAPRAPDTAVAAVAAVTTGAAAPAPLEASVRIDVDLLDRMMNQVGELVLTRNQILQYATARHDAALQAASQRLGSITAELQAQVMKTRMQPIGHVFNRFPRIARDLANLCGKRLTVAIEGESTELDRTLLETIRDPLTHVVRNAIDHGIETPEVRMRAGKPAEGRLHIRAFHEGGQINVEVSDDGRGIDPERLRQSALARGLITAEQAGRMAAYDLMQLIFVPGFSTAEKVSTISGRGVGMDVVRTNVEGAGGTVDVRSVVGRGTTIRVRIPLTLAIVPALIVRDGGHRYAIPQTVLVELVRVDAKAAARAIELVHATPVYRLRGKLLPIVFLREALGMAAAAPPGDAAAAPRPLNIVVLSAEDRPFGLVVDEIRDSIEIVAKPLGKQLESLPLFAGATVMGDGAVALILDVAGIGRRARIGAKTEDKGGALRRDRAAEGAGGAGAPKLLLCSVADGRRVGIPLQAVARIEEFWPAQMERLGDDVVVQYRGDVLRLISPESLLGLAAPATNLADLPAWDRVRVVACQHGERRVGLVVSQVIDIVDDAAPVHPDGGGAPEGTGAGAVSGGRVLDILDMSRLLARAA